tara:strand:+ start:552 stop:3179 length:2628 start_codon:yes stop_codon:yes gene_type:complete
MDNNFSLTRIIEDIKKIIPSQGPLDKFIHHNTLHHYEDLDFFEAIKLASTQYNTRAFMPEDFYIDAFKSGRIATTDLEFCIESFSTKFKLNIPFKLIQSLLLELPIKCEKNYDDKIHEIQNKYAIKTTCYYQHVIEQELGIQLESNIQTTVYKFLASYYDYGQAYWFMPNRNLGSWKCFANLHKKSSIFDSKFNISLSQLCKHHVNDSPERVINNLIGTLSLGDTDLKPFLFNAAYQHKGWAGFIKAVEDKPEWNNSKEIIPSFTDFMAISLVCKYAAIMPYLEHFKTKVPAFKKKYVYSNKFLHQFLRTMDKYPNYEQYLWEALPYLNNFNRQRIFHEAYEKTFYKSALETYNQSRSSHQESKYTYQVVTCIDDRLESFRRYLEIDQHCETFGCAGHFGLNIKYKGFLDKHYQVLCPANAKAEYSIGEKATNSKKWILNLIYMYGEIQWRSSNGSKTLLRGLILPFFGLIFNSIPFVIDIINPCILAGIKRRIRNFIKKNTSTELLYKKEIHGLGIPIEDRVFLASTFLKTIGLSTFSKYVFIMGHGSSSLNNPHEAAHDCGACGGGRGYPNARLLAQILNEKNIREILEKCDIYIPEKTIFIAAYHNTCNNEVDYLDVDSSKRNELNHYFDKIDQALTLDAKEKCRRYTMIPKGEPAEYYLNYLQGRAYDYRQPRPEYGHSTNAICIIAPRRCTKTSFLDRRALLVSYDHTQDENSSILEKVINTAVPVCAGINLEYYFSFVDNEKYGCGTKLPHNITSLIGVMNGHLSDLQLGLPWQMVEIHEPVRLLVIVRADLSAIKKMLNRSSSPFSILTHNGWIQLSVDDPQSGNLYRYDQGEFNLLDPKFNAKKYFYVDNEVFDSNSHLPFGELVHE